MNLRRLCLSPLLLSGLLFTPACVAQTTPAARASAAPSDSTWWKHAVIYEIYPRSFQDSNGDGMGDLNGITQRLDYLQQLGIDAIWIAPMFPSPQVDFGYDIADYEKVDPQYGTLADFDRLLAEAKKRNIRIILDMVLNHTSDKHPWFTQSAASRNNPKSDWFVWNDGKPANAPGVTAYQKRFEHEGMVPPNNWVSLFGGSAWEWVPARHQFYYHNFYKQQPDLNWSNPAVEQAMFKTMQFWLDRGVAGFRLDAITSMFEDPQLRNNVEMGGTNPYGDPEVRRDYTDNLPGVHAVMQRMRKMADRYSGDRVLIGETYLPDIAELDKWYGGAALNELHLPMDMLVGFRGNKWSASDLRSSINDVETKVHGGPPLLVFDNHDNTRSWDRFGDGEHNMQIARQLATTLLTTRAAALMYYGEEIGMKTSTPTRVEDVKDPIGIAGWPKQKGRDGERTPMQWDATPVAGFSANAHTWLPIPPDSTTLNVSTEKDDPASLWNWYHRLLALRRSVPALNVGSMRMINQDDPNVLSYVRTAPGGSSVLVAMNISAQPQTVRFDLSSMGLATAKPSTLMASEAALEATRTLDQVTLPAFSSWVVALDPGGSGRVGR